MLTAEAIINILGLPTQDIHRPDLQAKVLANKALVYIHKNRATMSLDDKLSEFRALADVISSRFKQWKADGPTKVSDSSHVFQGAAHHSIVFRPDGGIYIGRIFTPPKPNMVIEYDKLEELDVWLRNKKLI